MNSEPPVDREADDDDAPLVSRSRTRAEAIKRMQIGIAGLTGVLLLVGLANIIRDRANESELSAVPEAVSTTTSTTSHAPAKDPLADAGVVPELPADPVASAKPAPTDAQGIDDPQTQP
ncbi:hypothetical protein [Erythrobacter sp. SG61-1L]|uniref:hypothetical protein n=1 Tax=Erythrobacter sp. SG61-1L TaxID=1603897 RepID=UPI0006C93369|nr:hypothetical protein [Erythrobacter sp. SG61-1L]